MVTVTEDRSKSFHATVSAPQLNAFTAQNGANKVVGSFAKGSDVLVRASLPSGWNFVSGTGLDGKPVIGWVDKRFLEPQIAKLQTAPAPEIYVKVLLPKDRCKPGTISHSWINPQTRKAENFSCPVLGRGDTVPQEPMGAEWSPVDSPAKTLWKCGSYPNGKKCCYRNPSANNGATPTGEFTLWLNGTRPAAQESYGTTRLSCLEGRASNRNALRIHAGREKKKPNFYERFSRGCLRIEPEWQEQGLNRMLLQLGAFKTDATGASLVTGKNADQNTCDSPPPSTALKLRILEI